MQEIIKWVERIAADELEAANNEFPLFHSKHESLGVLLEEFTEASAEWEDYCKCMADVIKGTFRDQDDKALIARKMARRYALYCIAELIQNVAMLDKWTMSEKHYSREVSDNERR